MTLHNTERILETLGITIRSTATIIPLFTVARRIPEAGITVSHHLALTATDSLRHPKRMVFQMRRIAGVKMRASLQTTADSDGYVLF